MSDHAPVRDTSAGISGASVEEIVASIRELIDQGTLRPGDSLPPMRSLAETLGVNRNTASAAYRALVQANLAETRGRAGTFIIDPFAELDEEGFAQDTVLRDVGDGNPDPAFLPDPTQVRLSAAVPHLYGEATVDPGFAEWATRWIAADQPRPFRLTVAAGAVDAIERLLAQALAPGDAVALEDPCFLTSISTIRQNGYRAVPVRLDAVGMLPESLREALESGVRAVICTPRAHNPTGASLTAARAAELRAVLADFPQVLVIEDDHFSLLARAPYATIIGEAQQRWALVRSMSKALGPDMRIAVLASDEETAERLATRISGGITWVSHLIQRITHALLADSATQRLIADAGAFYAERNAAFTACLRDVGLDSASRDGLSVWVDTQRDASEVLTHLMRRGWIAREGASFGLQGEHHRALRLTVHSLTDADMRRLAEDLAAACELAAAPHAERANRTVPGAAGTISTVR
ncbi:aminotransferase class I/II-fold pyridoxal phosphate-dependent enzyme [Leucobacter chromiireducens]|uniref:Aminotransferase class I/II-fold pyridoxal phosphate-dependent enzyme n=1 Tax=Leucobacter chromiireducens subsp. solipictus TaxID=398235 RepID=A0ABS1SGZ3_9MICO|nr:aminotransferase class I/II-fold pyridoxal phosphate-dependent enzyme [Leucobacter chromiireducens]MBL3679156.1 aminotransferase class I/II-fold pyridoxal phosphate-dependent enzyme [Leucobacter chromiireducens subsp. solipictus]